MTLGVVVTLGMTPEVPHEKQLIGCTSLKLKTVKVCQANEKISHRLGENIYKRHI